ncbi:hypothetical protein GUITHDRAFT_140296 [Guillardia theta CCMP2712]|uniref:Fibronectin type-II domain-containing protein n=2 Tax=Guillardia theta TaxID=55529 RepID=L1J5R5_GUITC|nr:hypothetical protein GUITHDRAFT_140296 [Guillardia theta CCMP2712]EKX43873.1 hypothetical protein GUITHDRAFT_140296 [Guillardia theta CCMP2712]|mmetsp:Transcript_5361/g.18934  ORF Transcript_5361/g.18934 Transcript_5361/m.18934 type:complete len:448 (+) Transcript_5361:200-1543(+)|eukprot:XP_005830853.1 hypothetical protein GUITHDRAFT_140296 [Guillardia theta CCMP2712]
MQMKHVACGLAFLSACAVVLLSLSQRSSISSLLQTSRHVRVHLGPGNPLMKNIVIDKVYFPPGSHDSGLASVHGVVNGEYVQGNLRIKRIAHYHPRDGSWSGVEQSRVASYNPSAVQQIVSNSIQHAMLNLLEPAEEQENPSLPRSYEAPETIVSRDITKAAMNAVEEVLQPKETSLRSHPSKLHSLNSPEKSSVSNEKRRRRGGTGTVGGCSCKGSFEYEGEVFHSCTRRGRDRAWCYTHDGCGHTEAEGSWDYCEDPMVRTVKGCECDFPFLYKGRVHRQCVAVPGSKGTSWCKTRGECGQAGYIQTSGDRARWDHCELPPPAVAVALRDEMLTEGRADSRRARTCGASFSDASKHSNPFHFSAECARGEICGFMCSDPNFCPNCAGNNCRCATPRQVGEHCGDSSNRPPSYSSYTCKSGRCVFNCTTLGSECSTCNNGNCVCAA